MTDDSRQQAELQRRWFNFARALVAAAMVFASVMAAGGYAGATFEHWVEFAKLTIPAWLAWDWGRQWLKRGES